MQHCLYNTCYIQISICEVIIKTPLLSPLSQCTLFYAQKCPYSLSTVNFSHLQPGKLTAFSQTIFSDAFPWMKSFIFWLKFHQACSWGSNWQYLSIGLDNGLVPNRRQAIICTNADPFHWRIYAALWSDELNISTGSVYPNCITIAPAHVPAPNGARPSAGSVEWGVLNKETDMFLWLSVILHHLYGYDDVIQNGRRDLENSRSISCVNE